MFKILILFFVGIVACFFIAKVIIKFVPKKVQPVITILLYGAAFYLAYLSYQGVMEPIHFNKEKVKRYTKVIERLKVIRDAQNAHRTVTGNYAPKISDLVSFIDTAEFAVTEAHNEVRTVNLGGGLTGEEEFMVVDTVGTRPVKADFAHRNYKDMMKVPGTDAEFSMEIGTVEKSHGDLRKVYLVKVSKDIVLEGMNPGLILQEKATQNNDQVNGPDISCGSLADVSDSGNWPPSYDVNDTKKK